MDQFCSIGRLPDQAAQLTIRGHTAAQLGTLLASALNLPMNSTYDGMRNTPSSIIQIFYWTVSAPMLS